MEIIIKKDAECLRPEDGVQQTITKVEHEKVKGSQAENDAFLQNTNKSLASALSDSQSNVLRTNQDARFRWLRYVRENLYTFCPHCNAQQKPPAFVMQDRQGDKGYNLKFIGICRNGNCEQYYNVLQEPWFDRNGSVVGEGYNFPTF